MVCWSRWLIAPQIQGHSEYNSANQVPLVFAYTCQLFPVVELSYNLLCVKNKLRKCDDRRTDGWTDRRFDYAAIGGHVFGKVHYHWESAFVTPHWAGGCCDWMRIRALFGSLFLGKQLALTVCELTGRDETVLHLWEQHHRRDGGPTGHLEWMPPVGRLRLPLWTAECGWLRENWCVDATLNGPSIGKQSRDLLFRISRAVKSALCTSVMTRLYYCLRHERAIDGVGF